MVENGRSVLLTIHVPEEREVQLSVELWHEMQQRIITRLGEVGEDYVPMCIRLFDLHRQGVVSDDTMYRLSLDLLGGDHEE